ncbi:MAG: ABC transporter permease [Actinomycetes bacterium]
MTAIDAPGRPEPDEVAEEHGEPVLPSHVRPGDMVGLAVVGLRSRRTRTLLTAAGIAVGIAALVAVLGISASSRADLLDRLDALGTNRLQVQAGNSVGGGSAALDDDAISMIRRIGPVESASGVTSVSGTVRRSPYVDAGEGGGIGIEATDPGLLRALGGSMAAGRFLDGAGAKVTTVVLGSDAATTLGVTDLRGDPMVYLDDMWFTVTGIMKPIPLFSNLDSSAFVDRTFAVDHLGAATAPQTVYVVADPAAVDAVQAVLPATASPEEPTSVEVSRPTDAIAAKDAADSTLTALLLGLGSVALLVGAIGIANVMVIAVLERRTEIGVRRALGATKRHIRIQFLLESVLLAGLGGVAGVALGALVTLGWTTFQGSATAIPLAGVAAGVGVSLLLGAVAGLSPASRAARLDPADAIRPT